MKRIAYWTGVGMLWIVGVLVIVGFIERNGLWGAFYLAWLGVAGFLVYRFAPDSENQKGKA